MAAGTEGQCGPRTARSSLYAVRELARRRSRTTSPREDVEPEVARAVRNASPSSRRRTSGAWTCSWHRSGRRWRSSRATGRCDAERPDNRRGIRNVAASYRSLKKGRTPTPRPPEDALEVVRREVKRWRPSVHVVAGPDAGQQLLRTAFFVLAWDAFRAPRFPYDEALKLARAVGVGLDKDVVGRTAAKIGVNLVLWDSAERGGEGEPGTGGRVNRHDRRPVPVGPLGAHPFAERGPGVLGERRAAAVLGVSLSGEVDRSRSSGCGLTPDADGLKMLEERLSRFANGSTVASATRTEEG